MHQPIESSLDNRDLPHMVRVLQAYKCFKASSLNMSIKASMNQIKSLAINAKKLVKFEATQFHVYQLQMLSRSQQILLHLLCCLMQEQQLPCVLPTSDHAILTWRLEHLSEHDHSKYVINHHDPTKLEKRFYPQILPKLLKFISFSNHNQVLLKLYPHAQLAKLMHRK